MSKTKSDLRLELQIKHIVINTVILTAESIVNEAEKATRDLTEIEQATISGLLKNVDRLRQEADEIFAQLQWGND